MNIELLRYEIQKLESQITANSYELDKILKNGFDDPMVDELIRKEHSLNHRKMELEEELMFLVEPVITNEIIDLRKCDEYSYYICLHSTNVIIGNIQYRGYHISQFLGDVGYTVEQEYRGNGYAYQALELLGELLYEQGVPDFWISTYEENIPSLKTIEKYGAIKLENEENPNVKLYSCITKRRNLGENFKKM